MATPYSKIYDRVLAKITDYDLAFVPDGDLQLMLRGWLTSSISKFRKCASDLSDRDDELATFNVDLVDEEIEILALLMVCEWLEPQVNSVLLTHQMFGGKEEKFYAQANQLAEVKALRDETRTEARKLMRDYTYFSGNSYFDN
jgi:hypothetical protein